MANDFSAIISELNGEARERALAASVASGVLRAARASALGGASVSVEDVLSLTEYILTGLRPGEAAEILGQAEGHAAITTPDGQVLMTTDRVAAAFHDLLDMVASQGEDDDAPTWQRLDFESEEAYMAHLKERLSGDQA